jgi:uncharacterized MAPEG superfamily protein
MGNNRAIAQGHDEIGVAIMNVPVFVLLAFAGWTLVTLFGSIGVYRWSRILTGRVSISEWRADTPQGSEWYQRAMRAHMNCVENLPIFAALVVALMATGLQSSSINAFSVTLLIARIGQTLVHIGAPPTNFWAALRFALFFVQIMCMISIGLEIFLTTTK